MIQISAAHLGAWIASIPSPSTGELWLGPVPIRAYGLLMVSAMALAGYVTYRRYRGFGGVPDMVTDVMIWAIPFGIVGGRLYHVITTPHGYFGPDGDLSAIFRIWEGGMAIWGAIGLGAVGAVIALRRAGQRIGPLADALAPGLLFAQALGRFGNYFNQELFGSATKLPWGLEIDEAHLPVGYEVGTLFHPTFLYEGLWNVTMGLLLIYLGKRHKFKSGQVMALYMIVYPIGRIWMETMRLDEARVFFGLRLNTWTSILVAIAGVIVFIWAGKVGAPEQVSNAERVKYFLAAGDTQAEAEEKAHALVRGRSKVKTGEDGDAESLEGENSAGTT